MPEFSVDGVCARFLLRCRGPGREGTAEGRREGRGPPARERRGEERGSHYFPRGSPSPQVVGTRTVLLVGKGRSMSERSTVKKTFNMAPAHGKCLGKARFLEPLLFTLEDSLKDSQKLHAKSLRVTSVSRIGRRLTRRSKTSRLLSDAVAKGNFLLNLHLGQ